MEVLKDYPKEFAKLFRPSYNYLLRINMKFLTKDEGFVRKYWRFLYIIPCLVIHYLSLTWNLKKMVAEGEIFDLAYLVPPCLVCTQALLKIFILIPKTSLVAAIIEELGTLWRTTGLNETQKNMRDSLLKRMNFCNGMTFWVSIIGTMQYVITPLLETVVRRLVLKQDCTLLLAFQGIYPFDPVQNWGVYLAVYVFQTYSKPTTYYSVMLSDAFVFLIVSVYVGIELIMITLCALLGVEYALLCEDMLQVKPTKKGTQAREILSDDNSKEALTLKDIVKRHQRLCSLSKKLDEAFNQIIFIELLFVGLTTCFFRYAARFSRGPTYTFNNYIAVFFSLVSVLYLCYYGELLMGASLSFGDMAFYSLWYEGDKQHQRIILFIIMRSQKPSCLTSMKYAPITLNMFTKVMSTTWSYLSLMNTFYEEE